MKLVCNQNDLNSHLSLVSRAVPSKPSHPVLANVLLSADLESQTVHLTGFDLSLGIRTSFAAEVEEPGEITLPARLFSDIVSRLPAGQISLEQDLDSDTGMLTTLTSLSGQYQMRGMSPEEFPELPEIVGDNLTYLPPEMLIQGLRGTLFASSTEETKQILTGIHLSLKKTELEFAATDGHRLAVVQTTSQEQTSEEKPSNKKAQKDLAEAELDVTIPTRTLRELERMLAMRQSPRPVSLQLDAGQVIFEWDEQRLTSRLLEGQYPNYRQLIPREFIRQVTIERKLFLSALERISVLADQKNHVVKLTLSSDIQEVALSVDAQDVGMGREKIPAQISGESLEVAFNVKYLMDGLKAIDSAEIQLQLNTATSPVILTPLGAVKMTYLVMPIQVRN